MPVDISVKRSPGWWLQRLFNQLGNRTRRNRLDLLYRYRSGNAPLPEGAENARESFQAFQRLARSNFAELIVSAVSERMTPVGFRTKVDGDETGDAEVGALWERAGCDVVSAQVHDMALSLSESYVIVGKVDEETGAPLITDEDPRWMVGEADPVNPRRLLAALKVLHDDAEGEDRAYLYLPGEVWVAVRNTGMPGIGTEAAYLYTSTGEPWGEYGLQYQERQPVVSFTPQSWDWDLERSGPLAHGRIPVVRFRNKDGFGEYEAHTDLLRRINQQILMRMIISTMQAFRQRGIFGLPLQDEQGNEIDYSGVFTSDPAAIWQLPETAKMWESGQVDLTPILSAVKDDLTHLAAVSRTPMSQLSPAGVNQSAEGATLQREGLVFKVRDRISRCSDPWARVMSLALLEAGQADRADLSKLRTIWAPPEHLSLAERADAASKAAGDLPRRSRLIHIWGFSPSEADRMMTEWADDQLLAGAVASATAAANPLAQAQAPGSAAAPAEGPQPPVAGRQPAQPQPAPPAKVTAGG